MQDESGSTSVVEDLQQKVGMLRDYAKALQAENVSRNEERKVLEKEIEKLSHSQNEKSQKIKVHSFYVKRECQVCQVERLRRQNDSQKNKIKQSAELQLRNTKLLLEGKDSQISRLKDQMTKSKKESDKVHKLESQIRSMRYTITSKDSEISSLKNKKIQLQSKESSMIFLLEEQVKKLKNEIVAKNSEICSLKIQNTKQISLKGKISILEKQMKDCENKYNVLQEKNNSEYLKQIGALKMEIQVVNKQVLDKNSYIQKIENQLKILMRKDHEKNKEVMKLDDVVTRYVKKIGELEVELNKLGRNNSKYGKPSFTNTSSVIIKSNQQIILLIEQNKTLNQKIVDLSRRILILQQTNTSLREELKLSIEVRSRDTSKNMLTMSGTSPNNILEEEEAINSISMKILTMENQEIKQLNNKLKYENQYLQARVSSLELHSQKLIPLTSRFIGSDDSNRLILKKSATQKCLPEVYTKSPSMRRNSKNIKEEKGQNGCKAVLDDSERNLLLSTKSKQQIIGERLWQKKGEKNKQERDRKQKDTAYFKLHHRELALKQIETVVERQEELEKMRQRTSRSHKRRFSGVNAQENEQKSQNNGQQENYLSVGLKKSVSDDLERKIDFLKIENKELRQNLYNING